MFKEGSRGSKNVYIHDKKLVTSTRDEMVEERLSYSDELKQVVFDIVVERMHKDMDIVLAEILYTAEKIVKKKFELKNYTTTNLLN